MEHTDPRTRRHFLESTAAGAAVVALAGCLGPGAASDRTPVDDHGHDEAGHGHDEVESHHDETGSHHDEAGHGHEEATETHQHGTEIPSAPAANAEVGMVTAPDGSQHFEPHVAWVEPGGTVTWTLDSGVHTTTAYAPANDLPRRIPEGATAWDSGTMTDRGATYEWTFDTPGVYDYVCVPHEGLGMVGTVVVGEPDVHDQPGMATPQSSLPEGARRQLTAVGEMTEQLLGHPEE